MKNSAPPRILTIGLVAALLAGLPSAAASERPRADDARAIETQPLLGLSPDAPQEVERRPPSQAVTRPAIREVPATIERAIELDVLDSSLLEELESGPTTVLILGDSGGDGFDNLPVTAKDVATREELLEVVQQPGVAHVGLNHKVELSAAQSMNVVGQPFAASRGATGEGSYVAILDTGVRYTKPAFGDCGGGVGSPWRG